MVTLTGPFFKPKLGEQKIKDQNRKLNTTQNENHIVLSWLVSLKVLLWKHTMATLTLRLHTRRSTNRMVAEQQQLRSSFSVGRQCLRSSTHNHCSNSLKWKRIDLNGKNAPGCGFARTVKHE